MRLLTSLHLLNCSYLELKLLTLYFFLFSAQSHWGRGGKSEKLLGYWPGSTHHSKECVDNCE